MKNTKILVLALLVALLACLALSANADCAHPYDKWTKLDTKPATCTTDGTITWQCTNCGHIWYENIPNLGGHIRSGIYVCANQAAVDANPCIPSLMVEVCGRSKVNGGTCTHVFTDNQYTVPGDSTAHKWVTKSAEYDASCTAPGHRAVIQCSACNAYQVINGVKQDGSTIPAKGHDFSGAPQPGKAPTCAKEGYSYIQCSRCTEQKKITIAKTSYHTKADGTPKNGFGEHDIYDETYLPAKDATCTEPGCKAIYRCSTCGAVDPQHNGAAIPARGHKMVVDQTMTKLPTCTTKGQSVLYCTNSWDFGSGTIKCQHTQLIESPALGHSATWAPIATEGSNTVWELRCANCSTVLATKLVAKGEKAPSGTVNTGVVADTKSYEASNKGVSKVAKTNTTKKTTTKKTTTAKTTTTTKAATTTTAAAATEVKAEGTKLVAGINNLEDKAVVVVKDGKATLVYAEADVIVKIGETALEANVPVDVAADATATVAAADAAATK